MLVKLNSRGLAVTNSYVYALQCADGSIYTGWTTDINKRLERHNQGKGAKYTRSRLPVNLLACWSFESKSEALKFELWLKSLPRKQKQAQIQSSRITCAHSLTSGMAHFRNIMVASD